MHKSNLFYIFLMFFSLSFVGCKSKQSNNDINSKTLKMVEIPAIITDQYEALQYLSEHYWDNMDFGDTAYLNEKQVLAEQFFQYMNVLQTLPENTKVSSLNQLTGELLEGDSLVIDRFRQLIEKALYEPNSPYRNEELYIPVLKEFIQSPKIDTTIRERLAYQLSMTMKNRRGTPAIDFSYEKADRSGGTLYGINSEFVLLVFIDPDCPSCEVAISDMKASAVLKEFSKRLKILTLYAGVDHQRWIGWSKTLSPQWINGYDKKMMIQEGSLYDLRPTPSFYLLDREKVVILKDAPLERVVGFLREQK